jgi:hypothetical protein
MLTAFDPLTPERMSMAQAPLRTDSHMQNYEAHVKAVEEDLEYYRCKRVEPRITYFIRRGIIRLYDLLQATPAAVEAVAGARDAAGPDEDGQITSTRSWNSASVAWKTAWTTTCGRTRWSRPTRVRSTW